MDEIFDEDKAVAIMNSRLEESGRQKYPSDELINVIDIIWEYYEENGMLEVDDDDDDDENIAADLADYVRRMLKKDKQSAVSPDDIDIIVEAELEYEDSLIDF